MVKWNEITWYSKLGAIVLFIGVIPTVCFYMGTQYELTQQTIVTSVSPTVIPVEITPQNTSSSTVQQ